MFREPQLGTGIVIKVWLFCRLKRKRTKGGEPNVHVEFARSRIFNDKWVHSLLGVRAGKGTL